MKSFYNYHPIVNLIYFVFVITFSMIIMHPAMLVVSLVSSTLYAVILSGKEGIKLNILCMVPVILIAAIINPLFNHQGVTIIGYFKSGNPLTLESILYGITAAVMMVSVINWFACFNKVMSSDKLIYLFGKITPTFSLIFSMILRFIPRFRKHYSEVRTAKSQLFGEKSGIKNKFKNSLSCFSVMVTWSLENAINISDSMNSRGYGLSGRTSFSVFTFKKKDLILLLILIIFGILIICGIFNDMLAYRYFPSSKFSADNGTLIILTVYTLLSFLPLIAEAKEALKWKFITSKI